MSLPYENATSGTRAFDDIQKILTRFGAARFGTMTDNETQEVLVQFTYRGRNVSVRASAKGYAAAWLHEHPYSYRSRKSKTEHERDALVQAQLSVCSILRDWIKGQITAIEVGMLTFDGAFLGQILLPSGNTILDLVHSKNLLDAPQTSDKQEDL